MMKGGLGNLMKQAQQLQENMKRAQQELSHIEVEGQAGSGLVRITMTCNHQVRRVQIDDRLLVEDRDMLEDLLATAFNEAVRQVESTSQQKMGGLMGGMPLPPGMKMPF